MRKMGSKIFSSRSEEKIFLVNEPLVHSGGLDSIYVNHILWCIKHSIVSQLREVNLLFYTAMIQHHHEYYVQFWASQYKKDIKILESIQGSTTKMMRDLEGKK